MSGERFSYDERCEDLAEYLSDDNVPHNNGPGKCAHCELVRKLAQTIQDAIEDWLRERPAPAETERQP
jgi:hypothetical protein